MYVDQHTVSVRRGRVGSHGKNDAAKRIGINSKTGFEDKEVGAILGTSGNTGSGGANVWDHRKDLAPNLHGLLRSLPKGVEMCVGVLRTLRAGAQSGVPLEDLGVRPRKRHYLTRRE